MFARILIATVVLAAAVPAVAQNQNQPESPANRAQDVREQPVTDALNNAVASNIAAGQEASAADQAQYANDMAAYRAEMEAHHHEVMRDQAHYAHQQRAYADAMAQWRMQVAACERGHNRACKLPTPNPADYY